MYNISEILYKNSVEKADDIAFTTIVDNKYIDITYAELNKRVDRFARYVNNINEKKLSCILLFEQGIEVVVSFLACIRLGIIAIPMEFKNGKEYDYKLKNVVVDSNAGYIITNSKFVDSIKDNCNKIEVLNNISVICENYSDKDFTTKNSKVAFLQYTSGSTGNPKGTIITNDSLIENIKQFSKSWGMSEDSVVINWLPYFFDIGLIFGILSGIYVGCRTVLLKPSVFVENPELCVKLISKYKVTQIVGPNYMFNVIKNVLKKIDTKDISFSNMKKAICGGEPVDIDTAIDFLRESEKIGFKKNVFAPSYGLAEATLAVSTYKVNQPAKWIELDRKSFEKEEVVVKNKGIIHSGMNTIKDLLSESVFIIGCGYSIDEHCISICDMSGNKLNSFKIGEICFSGKSLSDGYWNSEKLSNNIFAYTKDGNKYLKTGDLGFIDEEGVLYITGRVKDLIVLRGVNYYPQDIEKIVFSSSNKLKEFGCAAFSIYDDSTEKVIIVQEVLPEYYNNFEYNDCASVIRKNVLDSYGIEVEKIFFIKTGNIPKTGSGKIQRQKSKTLVMSDEIMGVLGISNLNVSKKRSKIECVEDLKQNISNIVSEKLGINNLSTDETLTFNDMGVNSMISLQIIDEINLLLQTNISPVIIYNYNTINDLTNYLWKNNIDDMVEEGLDKSVTSDVEISKDSYNQLSSDEIISLLENEIGENQYD